MDDRLAQFYILVGTACSDARMGGFAVELTMADGERHAGVPDARPASDWSGEEVEDTGWQQAISVAGTGLRMQDVRAIRVSCP